MTSTQETVEVDPIEHLDEAWDIACEYQGGRGTRCGEHADWWLVCRACGASYAECDRHRLEQHHLWLLGAAVWLQCARCRAGTSPRRWRDLFTVTPIEGRP